jgi:hypothetical protein
MKVWTGTSRKTGSNIGHGRWLECGVRTSVICGVLSWWDFCVFFAHVQLVHSIVVMSCIITESIKGSLVNCLVGSMLLESFVAKAWSIVNLWIEELASGCEGQL